MWLVDKDQATEKYKITEEFDLESARVANEGREGTISRLYVTQGKKAGFWE